MYTQAINLSPDAVFYSNRAACYANLDDYESVIADCNRALDLDKRYLRALNRRAIANEKLKRWRGALQDYTVISVFEDFKNQSSVESLDRALKEVAKEVLDSEYKVLITVFLYDCCNCRYDRRRSSSCWNGLS